MILLKIFIIGGLLALLLALFFPIILLNIIRSMLGMKGNPKADPFQQHTEQKNSNKHDSHNKNKIFPQDEGEYIDYTEIK